MRHFELFREFLDAVKTFNMCIILYNYVYIYELNQSIISYYSHKCPVVIFIL